MRNDRGSPPQEAGISRHDLGIHHDSSSRFDSNVRHVSPMRQNSILRHDVSSLLDTDKWQDSRVMQEASSHRDPDPRKNSEIRPDSKIFQDLGTRHDSGICKVSGKHQDSRICQDLEIHNDLDKHMESSMHQNSDVRQDSDILRESGIQQQVGLYQNSATRPESDMRQDYGMRKDSSKQQDSSIRQDSGIRQDLAMCQDVVHQDSRLHNDYTIHRDPGMHYEPVKHQVNSDKQQNTSTTNREFLLRQEPVMGQEPVWRQEPIIRQKPGLKQEVDMQLDACRILDSDSLEKSGWKRKTDVVLNSGLKLNTCKPDIKRGQQLSAWDYRLKLGPELGVQSSSTMQPELGSEDQPELEGDLKGTMRQAPRNQMVWESWKGKGVRPGSALRGGSAVRPGSAEPPGEHCRPRSEGKSVFVSHSNTETSRDSSGIGLISGGIGMTFRPSLTDGKIPPSSGIPRNDIVHPSSLKKDGCSVQTDLISRRESLSLFDIVKGSNVTVHQSPPVLQEVSITRTDSVMSSDPSVQSDAAIQSNTFNEREPDIRSDIMRYQKSVINSNCPGFLGQLEYCEHSPCHTNPTVSQDNSVRSIPTLLRDATVKSDQSLPRNTPKMAAEDDMLPNDNEKDVGMPSDSVDDHFAKALGDTWLRIKEAKKEQSVTLNQGWPEQTNLSSALHHYSN